MAGCAMRAEMVVLAWALDLALKLVLEAQAVLKVLMAQATEWVLELARL